MIKVRELSKFYGKKPVVEKVTVNINRGKLHLLLVQMVQGNRLFFQWFQDYSMPIQVKC